MKSGNDLEIAPGFRASQWRALDLLDETDPTTPDWQKAISVFDRRMRSRFIEPVDALIAEDGKHNPKTFGFAILAIDCLLMESLQAFRSGVVSHDKLSKTLFTDFLKGWAAFTSCLNAGDDPASLAKTFYSDVRCELHHAGATGNLIRVGLSGPTFVFKAQGMEINRSSLHRHLVTAFESYLAELADPAKGPLRVAFRTKMAHVAR